MRNRADPNVELGRKAAIEANLLVTQEVPLLEGALINEGILHGPLDLVGELTRQQDPRDVGLDELHRVHGVGVGFGRQERLQMTRKDAHSQHPPPENAYGHHATGGYSGSAMPDLQVLEIANAIEARHSARVPFDCERPVSDRDLQRILEAARWAPTPHNMQNFEIIVIDDPEILEKIAAVRSTPSATFIRENYQQLSFCEDELLRKRTGLLASMFPDSWRTPAAVSADSNEPQHSFLAHALQDSPTLLIVLHDARKRAPASERDLLGSMSLGCVLQNMWLMATGLGISVQVLSALSGGDTEAILHRILDIPGHMQIAFACRLGYPRAQPPKYLRVRREVANFTHYNRYGTEF